MVIKRQNISITPKGYLVFLVVNSYSSPQLLATTHMSSVFLVLPFPEHPTDVITLQVAFCNFFFNSE